MFTWAIGEGLALTNPVTGTNRSPSRSRDRVLTEAELAAIFSACSADDYGRIVGLLVLTGQRRDEVGGMRWSEVDLDRRLWTIPAARTKNGREHIVPLTASAQALLPDRREGRDFIFGSGPRTAGSPHQGFSGWSKAKAQLNTRVEASGSAVAPWTLHDLRRTVATLMADRLGVLPHIIEAVLNHVSGHRAGVAGIYNRASYSAEMSRALALWAAHILSLIEGREPNVIPLWGAASKK
jgi:integrase